MARRRGQPVHGWVNLDKPKGVSSAKRWLLCAAFSTPPRLGMAAP